VFEQNEVGEDYDTPLPSVPLSAAVNDTPPNGSPYKGKTFFFSKKKR
jgi:hypothetical protein